MKKIILSTLITTSLAISASAYDTKKAQTYEAFYAGFTQQACAKSKLFIKADETMKMLRDNKKFTLLDIRTKGEHAVVALGLDNSIYIPLKDLFKKENLDKLPTDEPIIVVCHSDTRATLAVIGLKQIGIKNTRILEGGIVALADENTPKTAPLRLGLKIKQ